MNDQTWFYVETMAGPGIAVRGHLTKAGSQMTAEVLAVEAHEEAHPELGHAVPFFTRAIDYDKARSIRDQFVAGTWTGWPVDESEGVAS